MSMYTCCIYWCVCIWTRMCMCTCAHIGIHMCIICMHVHQYLHDTCQIRVQIPLGKSSSPVKSTHTGHTGYGWRDFKHFWNAHITYTVYITIHATTHFIRNIEFVYVYIYIFIICILDAFHDSCSLHKEHITRITKIFTHTDSNASMHIRN